MYENATEWMKTYSQAALHPLVPIHSGSPGIRTPAPVVFSCPVSRAISVEAADIENTISANRGNRAVD